MKAFKILLYIFIGIAVVLGLALIALYTPDIPIANLKAKYATKESSFIDIDGMQVHFRDEGNIKDTIPLVLIHGTSASLMTWDEMVANMISRKRVIRFDLPAFALTGPNKEHDYSIESYVQFVEKFLNKLGVKQCYLAGNSLGGTITWEYALAYPEKVKKIILIDAGGYPIDYSKGSLGFTLGRIPILKNLMTFVTPKPIVKKSLLDVYGDDSKVSDDLVDLYFDLTCREGNRDALIVRLNQPFVDRSEKIKDVKTPALIIWGELDQLDPLPYAHQFDNDLPNSELIVLKDIGHVPMEEVPELVGPLVEDFIQRN